MSEIRARIALVTSYYLKLFSEREKEETQTGNVSIQYGMQCTVGYLDIPFSNKIVYYSKTYYKYSILFKGDHIGEEAKSEEPIWVKLCRELEVSQINSFMVNVYKIYINPTGSYQRKD